MPGGSSKVLEGVGSLTGDGGGAGDARTDSAVSSPVVRQTTINSKGVGNTMGITYHWLPTAHGVRLFAIVADSADPSQRPTTADDDDARVWGRRTKFKGGVVTPRPPCRLPATCCWSNWLRSASVFLGLDREGRRA
jgi:hypothetical protein